MHGWANTIVMMIWIIHRCWRQLPSGRQCTKRSKRWMVMVNTIITPLWIWKFRIGRIVILMAMLSAVMMIIMPIWSIMSWCWSTMAAPYHWLNPTSQYTWSQPDPMYIEKKAWSLDKWTIGAVGTLVTSIVGNAIH